MKKIIVAVIFLACFFLPQALSAQNNNPLPNTTVNILFGRLDAGVLRVEKIAQRISSRIVKIKNYGLETTTLDSHYTDLQQQLKNLKSQLGKTQELATILLQSQNPKSDYLPFRNHAIAVRELLKEVLVTEKDIIDDMKQYATPASLPTAKALPTK